MTTMSVNRVREGLKKWNFSCTGGIGIYKYTYIANKNHVSADIASVISNIVRVMADIKCEGWRRHS